MEKYITLINYNNSFSIHSALLKISDDDSYTDSTIEHFSNLLTIVHNSGFFSCCSVRLYKIINYLNDNKVLPEIVDSSKQFKLYKQDENVDITFGFFKHYDTIKTNIIFTKHINIIDMNFQFDNYKQVDYKSILPFVKKYFTPSDTITSISNMLLEKYKIIPEKCIALYYRGTDKHTETILDSFDSYYDKVNEIITTNDFQILVQTDSAPFLDYIKSKYSTKNIIIISENSTSYNTTGIHLSKSHSENYIDIQNLFATFLILSKCHSLVTSSSNGAIWMMYFRDGNMKNVYQNLNQTWL